MPLLAAFFAGALGASAGILWNFGTSGPSRYAVWLSPFLIASAAQLSRRRWGSIALAGALAAQATVLVTRLPVWGEDDHAQHSYAARFVLSRWPASYNPHQDIFRDRTSPLFPNGPRVFRDGAGTCRRPWPRSATRKTWRRPVAPAAEQFPRWSREIARAAPSRRLAVS